MTKPWVGKRPKIDPNDELGQRQKEGTKRAFDPHPREVTQKYGRKIVWHSARNFQEHILTMVPASTEAVKKAKSVNNKEGKKMVDKFWYARGKPKNIKS